MEGDFEHFEKKNFIDNNETNENLLNMISFLTQKRASKSIEKIPLNDLKLYFFYLLQLPSTIVS